MSFLSIGALAKRYGLSRGALLHYDRIGLLRAGSRSPSGYRRYGPGDWARLESILELRAAGLSLKEIRLALHGESPLDGLLAQRLAAINLQLAALRAQQVATLRLSRAARTPDQQLNKATWTAMLREAGLSEAEMWRWHRDFEARHPEAHHDFLAFLGIAPAEIARIRRQARAV